MHTGKYERELRRLRAELEERNRNVVDQQRILELDERRRRAEEDKFPPCSQSIIFHLVLHFTVYKNRSNLSRLRDGAIKAFKYYM